MAKRKTFYVTMNVFESGIPLMAKLVLTYLSSCCNKEGTCFPSMATIARKCGICKSSARKGVYALESAGIISIKPSYTTSKNGKRRRQANVFTLHCPTAKNASAPVQQMYSGDARDGEEINNNSNMIMAVPSVGITDREKTELENILDLLHLDLYEDQTFASGINQAVRTMFCSDSITVKGNRIPQGVVRNVLHELTVDHIDYIEKQLQLHEKEIARGESYLISCIYNAPIDCMVNCKQYC